MQKKQLARAALMVFAAAALLGAGYVAGTHRSTMGDESAVAATASSDRTDPKTGRKVLYWHDPMVPNQHFDKPGKSPFMNMQLEPVYADEGGSNGIKIDPGLQQNWGFDTQRYGGRRQRKDSMRLALRSSTSRKPMSCSRG